MTIEDPSLSAHGSNCCPQQPVSKWVIIGNLIFQAYFEVFFSLLVEGELMTTEVP